MHEKTNVHTHEHENGVRINIEFWIHSKSITRYKGFGLILYGHVIILSTFSKVKELYPTNSCMGGGLKYVMKLGSPYET
jgi:hypothetical protein